MCNYANELYYGQDCTNTTCMKSMTQVLKIPMLTLGKTYVI